MYHAFDCYFDRRFYSLLKKNEIYIVYVFALNIKISVIFMIDLLLDNLLSNGAQFKNLVNDMRLHRQVQFHV